MSLRWRSAMSASARASRVLEDVGDEVSRNFAFPDNSARDCARTARATMSAILRMCGTDLPVTKTRCSAMSDYANGGTYDKWSVGSLEGQNEKWTKRERSVSRVTGVSHTLPARSTAATSIPRSCRRAPTISSTVSGTPRFVSI